MEHHNHDAKHMPLARVEESLDFIVRSHMSEARLLGGEPTVHPDFEAIVDRVLDRGLRLLIFSGGRIPERALRKLEEVDPAAVSVLLNVIPPASAQPADLLRQEQLFGRLGARIVLGLTIDSPGVELRFLVQFIKQYSLAPAVRLGLAHPTLEGSNSYLHPRHYPEVGRRVTEFGLLALEHGIRLNFDCGWVPCMFPHGALQALHVAPGDVGLRCNPIIDILPDGSVISCYPLANHSTERLEPGRDIKWMRKAFDERQKPDRVFMLYRECESCSWRHRGECTGGCLSASLRRLRQYDFAIEAPTGV